MSDQATIELLQRIDARLERLENKVNETPEMAMNGFSIFADSIDEKFNPATQEGLNNLDKVQKLQTLLEELTRDDTLDAFVQLTASLKAITPLLENLQQIENVASIAVDSMDEVFGIAMEKDLKVDEFLANLKKLTFALIDAFESGAFSDLLESGILDPHAIETVGALGRSMAVSNKVKQSAGPVSLIAALLNKDVQRALGFSLNFAAHFGRTLDERKRIK